MNCVPEADTPLNNHMQEHLIVCSCSFLVSSSRKRLPAASDKAGSLQKAHPLFPFFVAAYRQQQLQNQPFTHTVMASEKKIHVDDLKKYSTVRKVSADDLFGYENLNRTF